MYMHINSKGGVSLGGAIGGFFGDSFDLGSTHLFFPSERYTLVNFKTREEYEEAIRTMDTKDGLKLAIYGIGSIGLAVTASKLEEKGPKITTACSAAVCGVYALSAGYAIFQRHRRYAEYLNDLKKEKEKEEEAEKKEGD